MSPKGVHLLRGAPRSRRWIIIVSPILIWLLLYQLLAQSSGQSQMLLYRSSSAESSIENTGRHERGSENIGHSIDRIGITHWLGKSKAVKSMPIPPNSDPRCDETLRASMQDVLVILKTGATEPMDKIRAHVRTSLSCIPHFAIFSDLEEDIHSDYNVSIRTHDVLRNVNSTVQETNPDFDLYRRLRQSGRAGLKSADYNSDPGGPFGKPDNVGWKLDKWKFLPMIGPALSLHPHAKWFVFMEADTYIFWSNLQHWLSRFDASQPYYLGNQMKIGDDIFAHGGSGFVLSNPAMQAAFRIMQDPEQVTKWETFTASHWAGDCVFGKFLAEEVNVGLHWSHPMLQGDAFWEVDLLGEQSGKDRWCFPAVSYHHITAQEVEDLWKFEREWSTKHPDLPVLQSDIFDAFILPSISDSLRDNWENFSGDKVELGSLARRSESSLTAERIGYESPHPIAHTPWQAACHMACYNEPKCLQYTFNAVSGECRVSKIAIRGAPRPGVRSGWMPSRIRDTVQQRFFTQSVDGQKESVCEQGVNWILPS